MEKSQQDNEENPPCCKTQPETESKETPSIQVLDITENEDGTASISFEVSDEFLELVKKEKNLEEVPQEVLSEYVNELLTKCAENEDGYSYEKFTDKD